MTQTQYTDRKLGVSQADLILRQLQATPGIWVAMPTLCAVSGSFNCHSRIADLRKRGHHIEWRGERFEGHTLSFYRIIE